METVDVARAVADIGHYWGSDHEYSVEELFAKAQEQWRSARGSDTADKNFVLQLVACGLEEQLLPWLMRPHAADAADDIQTLVTVCSDPYFTTELLEPTLGALLTAAIVRAAGCDRNAENRKRRMAEMVNILEENMLTTGKAYSVLRTMEVSEGDTALWTEFLEQPTVLDPRVFNSRSGRTFMEEAGHIISLQQAELTAVRGSLESEQLGGKDEHSTANALWDLAVQLVELMEVDAKPSANVQDTDDAQFGSELVVVDNMASLEDYLKAKTSQVSVSSAYPNGSSKHGHTEHVELSAIEQLSTMCLSSEEELSVSRDILEKAFEELSTLKNLDAVGIQASLLLGLQMRLKRCFVDRCESAKDTFEKRIRRAFNRLTGEAQDLENASSLVTLAAFCPEQVIRQCIRDARTDVLHHSLYLEIFRASPLLLDWSLSAEGEESTVYEYELQQTLLDISSNQNDYDREGQNVISLLLSFVGLCNAASLTQDKPVLTISKLLDGVINPVCCYTGQSLDMQLNLYTLVQQLFQQLVSANAGLAIDPAALESSYQLALAVLCSIDVGNARMGVLVRERVLFLLKNIMELVPNAASMVVLDHLDAPLNPQLWTLLGLFNSDLGCDELCRGLEDVAAVEAFTAGNSVDSLPLPNTISAIQVLLWGLLWDSTLSLNISVESTKPETRRILDAIARHAFVGSDSVQTIKGSLLVQSAVAEMMLECGSVLFRALLSDVIPYLLEYELTEPGIFLEERLTIPKWATDKLAEQPEVELQIPSRLESTHSTMSYVAKCWGLSGAANSPTALLVESLGHVLVAHDQAISSSQRSLSGTLFCFQWLCFLVSAALELHLDAISTWPTLRTQLELSLLRLLHQLDQLKGTSTGEAHFSQYFVAAWLAYLPAGQFDQVFNFVASRAKN